MPYFGYAGTIAYVDLSTGSVRKEPLDMEVAKKYIGGWGINYRLIYDLLKPGIDPFSPQNAVIFGAGPLVGTLVPGSSKFGMTTKFPNPAAMEEERYTVATGIGGGRRFGLMLKNAGYDHVVITGRASRPSYLLIDDDNIEIRDASDLWGKLDIYQTVDELAQRHPRSGVVAIGRAGENLVRFAHATCDKSSTIGANGGAAILGSKNLKAIVTHGTKGVKVADSKRLMRLVDWAREKTMSHPQWRDWVNYAALVLGGENWRQTQGRGIAPYDESIVANMACSSCIMPCRTIHQIRQGEHTGATMQTSQFMTIPSEAGRMQVDWRAMVKYHDQINRLGMNSFTSERIVYFVTKLYERGVIKKVDGLEPAMGDLDYYMKLTEKIANREGIGGILADGWYAISKWAGVDAADDLEGTPLCKGSDGLYDARFVGLDAVRFICITNPRGEHHMHSGSYFPDRPVEEIRQDTEEMAPSREAIERIFGRETWNIGRLTKHAEDAWGVYNSLGICSMYVLYKVLNVRNLAEFYSAATGIEVSPEELKKRGERVWNLYKLLNVREGFSRKDDWIELWVKSTEEPIRTSKGEIRMKDYFGRNLTRADVHKLLDDYYDERGWDIEKGMPTKEKLLELGLGEFAQVVGAVLE